MSNLIVTDKNIILKKFNYFLNSIALKIDTKIIKTDSKFYETLKNPNSLNPTTKEGLEDNVKLLNETNAIEINNNPTTLL